LNAAGQNAATRDKVIRGHTKYFRPAPKGRTRLYSKEASSPFSGPAAPSSGGCRRGWLMPFFMLKLSLIMDSSTGAVGLVQRRVAAPEDSPVLDSARGVWTGCAERVSSTAGDLCFSCVGATMVVLWSLRTAMGDATRRPRRIITVVWRRRVQAQNGE